MNHVEDIECAIARWWPDLKLICAKTGARLDQVRRVYAAMEAIHTGANADKVYRKLGDLRGRWTRCGRGHRLDDPANVYVEPSGLRHCRECKRIHERERRRRVSAAKYASSRPNIPRQSDGQHDQGLAGTA